MKVLTEQYVFVCNCGTPAGFKATDHSHFKTTSMGTKILTSNSVLTGSGICPKLGPGPCAFVQAGCWMNTSGKFSVNAANVLTDKSYLMCAVGGKITPNIGITKFEINRSSPVIPPVNISASVFNTVSADLGNDGTGQSPGNNSADLFEENQNNDTSETDAGLQAGKSIEEKSAEPSECPDYPYALCDYRNCPEEKRKECDYLKEEYSADSVKNDSGKLEDNFRKVYPEKYNDFISDKDKKYTSYISETQKIGFKTPEGTWKYAAHHIISGNQIFARHPFIVKLANFYKYDINNADNCILLPGIYSFSGKQGLEKQANIYTAMDAMKLQWHSGGHEYTLEQETIDEINKFLEKTSDDNITFYKNYAEAVEHEINILESKYRKISCRKNDYESKQKRFIENMNSISKKVGQKLFDFKTGYKKSFPFYVSKEAYKFAFDVPRRKKFIIIYKKERLIHKFDQIVAVKMTVTRYQKDDYRVLFTGDDEFIIKDASEFIKFAENVKYFICLTMDYSLPWNRDSSREYLLTDNLVQPTLDAYCKENEQKIISFVEGRENGEMYYEPATRIIKQRLNDILME